MKMVSVSAALALSMSLSVNADVVYDFEAQCSNGCTGTATGVLTLRDSYVPGSQVTSADFISLSYTSSSGSFSFDSGSLNRMNRGILPVVSGPSIEWVEVDAIGSGTSLHGCAVAGTPDTYFCPSDEFWSVEWVPIGISRDYGPTHTWTLRPTTVSVSIDIVPIQTLECRNATPVVIYGAADFVVTDINTETLKYGDSSGGRPTCRVRDINNDGYQDLVCRFVPGTAEARLSGTLTNGTGFRGTDSVCIR